MAKYQPIYTREGSMYIEAGFGTPTTYELNYGYWIPERDFFKMGLDKIVFPYYGSKDYIPNRIIVQED